MRCFNFWSGYLCIQLVCMYAIISVTLLIQKLGIMWTKNSKQSSVIWTVNFAVKNLLYRPKKYRINYLKHICLTLIWNKQLLSPGCLFICRIVSHITNISSTLSYICLVFSILSCHICVYRYRCHYFSN